LTRTASKVSQRFFTKELDSTYHDIDTVLLEVNDFVAESQSKLLSLDRLVNVVTGERPPEASNGTSKHALHGLLGDRGSVLALLDGHRSGTRDVTDDDRRTDATRAVRLDPSVGSENVTLESFSKVLHHVVTLGLTVNVDIKTKLILDLNAKVDLLADELVVLFFGDFTLGELVSLNTDFLSLGEGTDGGGGEEREGEVSLLLSVTGVKDRLAVELVRGNLALAILDLGVVGTLGLGTRLQGGSIGIQLALDGSRALSSSLGEDSDFAGLFDGEREPLVDFLGELLLAGKGVRDVKERAGGGDDDTLLSKGGDGSVNDLEGLLEVVLPDVTSVNNTQRQNLLGTKALGDSVQLLGVADKVHVNAVQAGESWDNVDVVDDVSEVGSNNNLGGGASESTNGFVGRLEGSFDLRLQVKDKDWLIDLNTKFHQIVSGLSLMD
jgi:hypothetical protein